MELERIAFLDDIEELSEGTEKPVVKDTTVGKLLEAYYKVKGLYRENHSQCPWKDLGDYLHELVDNAEKKIVKLLKGVKYNEKDISDLVASQQLSDETRPFGAYVGSLISLLTDKNEKLGKKTVINIEENRLDHFGACCRKFDAVKIGNNTGTYAFEFARAGNELSFGTSDAEYVLCEAKGIKEINADVVDKWNFLYGACLFGANINVKHVKGHSFGDNLQCAGKIKLRTVDGDCCLSSAAIRGIIREIHADVVNGEGFGANIGYEGSVGKIQINIVNCDNFGERIPNNIDVKVKKMNGKNPSSHVVVGNFEEN